MASLVKVLIATTAGPVEIRDLWEEDPRYLAQVEYSGRAYKHTEFTKDYRGFVSREVGLIGRLYGRESFGLELSGPITDGDSWQLGILLAHALLAAGRLSTRNGDSAPNPTVVLATGEVERDQLRVIKVEDVRQKLDLALPILAQARNAGSEIIIALPKSNHDDAEAKNELLNELPVELMELEYVAELLSRLGLPTPDLSLLARQRVNWKDKPPFRGLQYFDAKHRAIFFGRDKVRKQACSQLEKLSYEERPFLLIYGGSGAGKSSLVRAGLLGDILERKLPEQSWRSAILPSGPSPVTALAEAVKQAVAELSLTSAGLALAIKEQTDSAAADVTMTLARANSRLVLVVDQFEEVFLWAREKEKEKDQEPGKYRDAIRERDAFAGMLQRFAGSGVVWIIATIRTDLLALLQDVPDLFNFLTGGHQFPLGQPNRAELRDIITRPAELAGLDVEPSLIEALLDDAGAIKDSLPLLEFTLDELYRVDGPKGRLTFETYVQVIKGLVGAIGKKAEETVKRFGDDEAVKAVILALGRYDSDNPTSSVVARTVTLDDKQSAEFFTKGRRGEVIFALESARLVVRGTSETAHDGFDASSPAAASGSPSHRIPIVRVAHEALLKNWPRAAAIFKDNVEKIALRDRLKEDAKQWADPKNRVGDDRDANYLPKGRRLEAARELKNEGLVDVSELVREFIDAAIKKDEDDKAAELRRKQLEEANRKEANEAKRAADEARSSALEQAKLHAEDQSARAEEEKARAVADAAKERRRRNLAAVFLVIFAGVAVLAGAGFAVALHKNNQLTNAETLAVLSQAKNAAASGDYASAIFYAMQAVRIAGAGQDRGAIAEYLDKLREAAVFDNASDGAPSPPSAPPAALGHPQKKFFMASADDIRTGIFPPRCCEPPHELFVSDANFGGRISYESGGAVILARSESGRQIRLWDSTTHSLLFDSELYPIVSAAAVSPEKGDDRLFLAIGNEVRVYRFHTNTSGPRIFRIEGDGDNAAYACWRQLSGYLPVLPADLVPVYDTARSKWLQQERDFLNAWPISIDSIAVSPGGERIAVATSATGCGGRIRKRIVILDANDGTQLVSIESNPRNFTQGRPLVLKFGPNPERTQLLALYGESIEIRDLDIPDRVLTIHQWFLDSTTLSPNGRYLLTVASHNETILWDLQSEGAEPKPIFSNLPDKSDIYASAGTSQELPPPELPLKLPEPPVAAPARSPQDAVGELPNDGFGGIGRIVPVPPADVAAAIDTAIAHAPPASSDQAARDAASAHLRNARSNLPNAAAGGEAPHRLKDFDAPRERDAQEPSGPHPVEANPAIPVKTNPQRPVVTSPFSRDGSRVLIVGESGRLEIWEMQSLLGSQRGEPWARINGRWEHAALSPDGTGIVATDGSAVAHLLPHVDEQKDGQKPNDQDIPLAGHTARVREALFGPDGKSILTRANDETVRMWRSSQDDSAPLAGADTAALIERAERELPRCLPQDLLPQAFLSAPPYWCVAMEKWPYAKPH
jgi:WD40 repeat protein